MSEKFIVDIKDFQSLKSVHLDIPKGVCIITGSTNNGKSAVFRAIDAALFNLGDDSMIRGGKRYYGVSIDNGLHKMVYMRDGVGKNEKSAYQFDGGTVQKKVGRSQLPEVANMFNIRDVKMQNGSKMKINFWYQNDKPFLMDKTSGQLYEFLSLSSCDKYSKVLKTMKSDSKSLEHDISSISTEIDTLKTINNKKQDFIDKNKGFDEIYKSTVILSQQNRNLSNDLNLVDNIVSVKKRVDEVGSYLKVVSAKCQGLPFMDLLSKYNTVCEDNSSLSELITFKNEVKKSAHDIDDISSRLKSLDMSSSVSIGLVENFSSSVEYYSKESDFLSGIDNVIQSIQSGLDSIKLSNESLKYIGIKLFKKEKEISNKISKIENECSILTEIEDLVGKIRGIKLDIDLKQDELLRCENDIRKQDDELRSLKKSVGYCPFCGTVFRKEVQEG